MTPERAARETLPDAVSRVLVEFRRSFALDVHLWHPAANGSVEHLFPGGEDGAGPHPESILLEVPVRVGSDLVLEIRNSPDPTVEAAANALRTSLEQLYELGDEIRLFTSEVSERFEEINLLYSISETLGSLLNLREAARNILAEVCDVLGARRGSLWVQRDGSRTLDLVSWVGDEERTGELDVDDPSALTSQVFREGRPLILTGERFGGNGSGVQLTSDLGDSVLSVPIRFTPPSGDPRTVGVINLAGRRRGGRFSASDQKLLAAIASQVGAALENNRLVRESLARERVSREMELASDLQRKLLPTMDGQDADRVAARVESADSVGGDFYHILRLPGGRFGVMIGDVSSHGFPAALIMTLSMSAATIYAAEFESPARVLAGMGRALIDELETTEMYLTLFYGVVDPARGTLVYANAGHPHAFVLRPSAAPDRLPALDPPMGIAGAGEYQEHEVPWTPDEDLLLLFTDGLSDPVVPGSRSAGEARIVEETARLSSEPAGTIVRALFELSARGVIEGGEGDDRTAVVFRA
jgi:phosphoserine phosphatase RsbU/P